MKFKAIWISLNIPQNHYGRTKGCILKRCIMAWFDNTNEQKLKRVQRMVNLAQSIMSTTLSSIENIYIRHCLKKSSRYSTIQAKPPSHYYHQAGGTEA